jgi:hypothetical protein
MRSLVSHVPKEKTKETVSGVVAENVEEVKPGQLEDSLGRLIIEEERSRYVSGSSWANLADQVRSPNKADFSRRESNQA